MKIVFTGGGTGGHIFPIIAIIREIRKISSDKVKIFYLGPKDEFAQIFLTDEEVKVKWIICGKLRRYLNFASFFQNIFDILKIPIGTLQAFVYLFFINPDLIFSKGGFGSIPTVIAGWLLRIPIFLHESDAVPGLANRFLAKFALEIFVSFPRTLYFPINKMTLVGNPIRIEILKGNKSEAIEYFKITQEKPVILIIGGSQGAQRINEKILLTLNELLENFEIIHQTGTKNFKELVAEAEAIVKKDLLKYYHPIPFLREDELKKAYSVCDIIVARAGSGTIFEIAALGKPSILIPLPESAQDHQLKNAYAYFESGATIVIEEKNFTPSFFLNKLKFLFNQTEELEKMSIAAKNFSRSFAAKVIAHYIFEFLKKER
jgi:UDP-N-acetylglucosamine--N-acetylmuramyl-(pentapeptide) pyrophosphoryl-undecaprenol N-acetylglucosamine transferase